MTVSELKWVFPTVDVSCQEQGPQDLAQQSFSVDVYNSIAREAIQNSLDAALDEENPVEVRFQFGSIKNEDFDKFKNFLDSICEHIEMCREKYSRNRQEEKAKVYEIMQNHIDRFRRLRRLPYLKIADYGTTGMLHNPKNLQESRMNVFMHKDGENMSDRPGSGGANGIGKMAYFALSPLNMVLANTYTMVEGDTCQSFFSGTTKLVTHPFDEENNYQYAGYLPEIPRGSVYSTLNPEEVEDLPFAFSRNKTKTDSSKELGTSFYIIGAEPIELVKGKYTYVTSDDYDKAFDLSANALYSIIEKNILWNYFVSIKYGKLSVQLGSRESIKIDRNNVDLEATKIFESNRIGWKNPLPFLNALKEENFTNFVDSDKQSRKPDSYSIHKELELDANPTLTTLKPVKWGKIRLCVWVSEELNGNKILAMRAPLMVVSEFKPKITRGSYAGLLICDEENNYANQLLRASEPATHDLWKSNIAPKHGESEEHAEALLKVIGEWVEKCLAELFPNNNESTEFEGARKFLCIYDSADASQRNSKLNCRAVEGATTTISVRRPKRKESRGSLVSGIQLTTSSPDEEGTHYTGGNGGKGGGGSTSTSNPSRSRSKDDNGRRGPTAQEATIKFKSFAQKDNDIYTYTVVLAGLSEEFQTFDLQFMANGENGREILQLSDVKDSEGRTLKHENDKIYGLKLKNGETLRLYVRFKLDTMPFSISCRSTIESAKETQENNSAL